MDPNDKQKILSFVNHLLSIPNIKSEPPVIREGMIISFITKNLNQIKETMASPDFFPKMKPADALKMVLQVLKQRIVNEVITEVEEWLNERVAFRLVQKIFPNQQISADHYKSMLLEFMHNLISFNDARYNFNSVINIFKYQVLERYISEIFERRGYIFNEIRRVEKTDLGVLEYIEYSKLVFLIKNIVYMRIPVTTNYGERSININEIKKFSIPMEKLLNKQEQLVKKTLPFITQKVFMTAVKSNIKKEITKLEEASSRLYYILASRYQEFKYQKTDRGAETQDKSWYNIARRNHTFYGFDKNMVNELYLIAGDNLW